MADYNSVNGYGKRKHSFTSRISKFTIWSAKDQKMRDVSMNVHDVKWKTDLKTAAELTFKVMRGKFTFVPLNGDQVQFSWNGTKIFTGWVFNRKLTENETWEITAYGNSRYLKGTGTYNWPAASSSDRFKRIASDLGLPYQVVDKSSYKVGKEITDGKTFFDMIDSAFSTTKSRTGKRYLLIDDPSGKIQHISSSRLSTNLLIGDKANVESFSFEGSIEDTSNIVQVIHEDSKTKKRELRVARDSKSVKNWGPLVHTETVTGDVNTAQLQDKAKSLLRSKNREKKTLTLKALGDTKIRAGSSLYVQIGAISGVGVGKNRHVFVTSATHNFDNPWTMELEVELI